MKRASSGFTLVELMIVIVIVGIAAAIGLPNFTPMVSKVRMDGEISALVSGLNFARSEAQKRGQLVSVCPTTNGTSCNNIASWSGGWIVQLDGPPTQLLQYTPPLSRDVLSSTSTASILYPQFTSMGYTFFNAKIVLNDSASTVSLKRCLDFSSGTWTSKTGAACP